MNYTQLAEHIKSSLFKFDHASGEKWPSICDLHDAFAAGEMFTESHSKEAEESHNCLGCNFAHYTWGLLRSVEAWAAYLETTKDNPPAMLEDYYPVSIVFHWLNTLVDAHIEILKILDINEGRVKKHFPVFKRIRMWANFFKHPKAMVLTHHATYGFTNPSDTDAYTMITERELEKFYRGDQNNRKLFDLLTNKHDVYVLLPDLKQLITEFSASTSEFVSLLSDNKLFKEELRQKTTYENFYADEIT